MPALVRIALFTLVLPVVTPAHAEEGLAVQADEHAVVVSWPTGREERGVLRLNLTPGRALIQSLGIGDAAVLNDVDPVYFLTVGSRESPPDRPPSMSVFNVFFDSPAKRPFQRYRSTLKPTRPEVLRQAGRVTVRIGGLTAGPFTGALEFTVYGGATDGPC